MERGSLGAGIQSTLNMCFRITYTGPRLMLGQKLTPRTGAVTRMRSHSGSGGDGIPETDSFLTWSSLLSLRSSLLSLRRGPGFQAG